MYINCNKMPTINYSMVTNFVIIHDIVVTCCCFRFSVFHVLGVFIWLFRLLNQILTSFLFSICRTCKDSIPGWLLSGARSLHLQPVWQVLQVPSDFGATHAPWVRSETEFPVSLLRGLGQTEVPREGTHPTSSQERTNLCDWPNT